MTWKKTPPTESGYFWWRRSESDGPSPALCFEGQCVILCEDPPVQDLAEVGGEWWNKQIKEPRMEPPLTKAQRAARKATTATAIASMRRAFFLGLLPNPSPAEQAEIDAIERRARMSPGDTSAEGEHG